MDFKYESKRLVEKVFLLFVWKLPRKLVYWCAIRVGANATTGEHSDQSPTDLNFMDAIKRWEPPKG